MSIIKRGSNLGRIGFDFRLFAFMENIRSLRGIEKACQIDIRFTWLSNYRKPSHATLATFINEDLSANIDEILIEFNIYFITKQKI